MKQNTTVHHLLSYLLCPAVRHRQSPKQKEKDLDFQKSSFEKLMDRMEWSERENRELLKQMDENSNRTILALAELLK